MQTNSHKPQYNWENYSLSDIINGIDENGVRFLQLFLIDYTAVFSEVVNAGCTKCLNNYLQKYKSKFFTMETNSNYILKKKFEGISLNDHSSVMVNNRNITDAYAEELLKRYSPETIFEKYPKKVEKNEELQEIEVVDSEIISTSNETKNQRKNKKRNRV